MSETSKKTKINVFVRIRPPTNDARPGQASVVENKGAREVLVRSNLADKAVTRSFYVDRVFGPNSRQIDVYSTVAEPMVKEVIKGYNCTIFAYGQTGSGKTYTMQGGGKSSSSDPEVNLSWQEDEHTGIIPRVLSHLFDELRVMGLEYSVRVSYFELYNEEIYDLLSPPDDNTKLRLYEDSTKKGSHIVQSATEASVTSKSEVYRLLEKGANKRKVAATLMNAHSSRSHTVFCITVHTKENIIDGEDLIKVGKLYLVDLAGSENINKSGATDRRAREAVNINQSLLTLGRCIVALAESRGHVPFRESKLTRLLQDSLGGCTKTTLIATVSPSLSNVDETLNTLEYANRAKHITNKPELNMRTTKKALMKDYEEKINKLSRDLDAIRLGTGFYIDKNNYDEIMKELELRRDEISEKITQIRVLKEEMMKAEAICNQLKIQISQQNEEMNEKVGTIDSLKIQIEDASKEIQTLQNTQDEHKYLIERKTQSEALLQTTAKKLMSVAGSSVSDIEKLHQKVDALTECNEVNRLICTKYLQKFTTDVDKTHGKLKDYKGHQNTFYKNLNEIITQSNTIQNESITNANDQHAKLTEILTSMNEYAQTLEAKVDMLNNKAEHSIAEFSQSTSDDLHTLTVCIQACEAYVQGLCDAASENKEDLDSYKATATSKLDWMKNEVEHHIDDMVQAQKDVVKIILKQTRTIDCICRNVRIAIEARSVQCDEDRNNFTKYIQKTCKWLNKASEAFYSKIEEDKCTIKGLLDQLTLIQDASLRCVRSHSHYQIISDTNVKQFKDRTSFNTDEIKHILNVFYKDSLSQVEYILKENPSLDMCRSTLKEVFTRQQQLMEEYVRDQCTSQKELCESDTAFLKSMQNEIKAADDTNENTRNSIQMTELLNKATNLLNENEDETEQHCNVLSSEMRGFLEESRKHFSCDVKEYKPTGETPGRKQYRIPSFIPSPKPANVLLEEFHKKRPLRYSKLPRVTSESDLANIENIPQSNQSESEKTISKISNYPGDIISNRKCLMERFD